MGKGMTRLRGIVKAVVTIAGAVSLSSPLIVSGGEGSAHKGQKSQGTKNGHELGVFNSESLPASANVPESILGRISHVQESPYFTQTSRVRR
jgi:hypothetical protein